MTAVDPAEEFRRREMMATIACFAAGEGPLRLRTPEQRRFWRTWADMLYAAAHGADHDEIANRCGEFLDAHGLAR